MIIDCIADLHGFYPSDLPGGDLLIIAGDLTATDTQKQHLEFVDWLYKQKYEKKVWIAGNHDNFLQNTKFVSMIGESMEYLCDSGTEYEGLKIYGSPWTKTFPNMNSHCKAFTCDTEEQLAEKWDMIPDDTDILVTHSPPYGILDEVKEDVWRHAWDEDLHVGSKSLALKIGNMDKPPLLWCWGHIHEAYGEDLSVRSKPCRMINCSLVNERYQPVNKPVRVIL